MPVSLFIKLKNENTKLVYLQLCGGDLLFSNEFLWRKVILLLT